MVISFNGSRLQPRKIQGSDNDILKQVVGNLSANVFGNLSLRFDCRSAQVRCGDEIIQLQKGAVGVRLVIEYIQCRSRDLSALQRGIKIQLIDDSASGA